MELEASGARPRSAVLSGVDYQKLDIARRTELAAALGPAA